MAKLTYLPLLSALAFTLIPPGARCLAAPDGPEKLSIKLTLNQQSCLPFESVGARIEARNDTDAPIMVPNAHFGAVVSYQNEKEAGWYTKTQRKSGLAHLVALMPPPAGETAIKVGETVLNYKNMSLNFQKEPVFAEPGVYFIKARFRDAQTPIQRFVVQAPTGVDVAALKAMKEQKLYRYLDPQQLMYQYLFTYQQPDLDPNEEPFAKEMARVARQMWAFSERFPKSRYAHWSRYAMTVLETTPLTAPVLNGSKLTPQTEKKLLKLQKQFERTAQSAPYPINAAAWFEAGIISAMTVKKERGRPYFERALQLDPTLECRRDDLFEISRAFEVPQVPHEPKAILDETIRDLKSKGYDVDNFAKNYPEAHSRYINVVMRIFEKRTKELITEEERTQMVAKVLREFMTVYTYRTPVTPHP